MRDAWDDTADIENDVLEGARDDGSSTEKTIGIESQKPVTDFARFRSAAAS